MIRQPSLPSALYAWHRAALAGERPPIHDGLPECGWFRARMVKGGPWVSARIWITREIDEDTGELTGPEVYRCEIDGVRRRAEAAWLSLAHHPISRGDYDALRNRKAAIPQMAATHVAIDLTQEPMRP